MCQSLRMMGKSILDAGSGRLEQKVELDGGKMAKLLRWVVHSLEIFMWPQDYGRVSEDGDPFMELMAGIQTDDGYDLEEYGEENSIEEWEFEDAEPEGELSWRVQVEYSNGMQQDMFCYESQLMDKPEELY